MYVVGASMLKHSINDNDSPQRNAMESFTQLRSKGTDTIWKNRTLKLDDKKTPLASDLSIASQPLHILLVTETWSPEVNGVAMSLGQLMQQLKLKGHQISLLRPKPKQTLTTDAGHHSNNESPKSEINEQCGSYDLQVKGFSIPKYSNLQFGMPAYFKIRRYLKQLQPDVVHIATEGPLGFAALLAAKGLKITVTSGYHTQFHDFSRHFGLGVLARPLMAYFKWFHNMSSATCVPSQKTFKELNERGFKRLYEVGRGVDLARFNPLHRSEELRAQWEARNQHTVLLMVSRLSPEKGIDLVIQSFMALQREQLQRAVKLVIVGEGPDRARLESLTADNKEDIIFTGQKTGKELSEHYASADVFVFASQVETFGNVVVEAMASGLPVYAFDDAAAGMLVTEANGMLINRGDKKQFVEKVANLPKMQILKEQGMAAVNTVAGFSWEYPADQMLTMFFEAFNHSRSKA